MGAYITYVQNPKRIKLWIEASDKVNILFNNLILVYFCILEKYSIKSFTRL